MSNAITNEFSIQVEQQDEIEKEMCLLKKFLDDVTAGSNTAVTNESDPVVNEDENCNPVLIQQESDNTVETNLTRSTSGLFQCQEELNTFTLYVFERRFGWSEQNVALADSDIKHGRNSPELAEHDHIISRQARRKSLINEKLNDCLEWFVLRPSLRKEILKSFCYTFQKASRLPVVRNQVIIHLTEWLIFLQPLKADLHEETFNNLLILLKLGLTDVWSAVRNSCTGGISVVLDILSVDQLQALFRSLIQTCSDRESPWQAKEGCIKGIATILNAFTWVIGGDLKNTSPASKNSPGHDPLWLKIGRHKFPSLPSFIVEPFESVVFKLLSHSQLSIRENASKALSVFLSGLGYDQIVKTFREVILLLARIGEFVKDDVAETKIFFMDAYWAEGLLGVAEFLIKRISPDYILHNWDLCMAVFLHYLMHPASTVRQSASNIFKYLVSKNCSEPRISKIVLQSLAYSWETDLDIVTSEGKIRHLSTFQGHLRRSDRRGMMETTNIRYDSHLLSTFWEWREGRMMAYELIFKYFITSHIHYCFPQCYLYREGPLVQSSVDEKSFKRMARYSTDNLSRSVRMVSRKSDYGVPYQRSLTIEHADYRMKSKRRVISTQGLSLLNNIAKLDKNDLNTTKFELRRTTESLHEDEKAPNPLFVVTNSLYQERLTCPSHEIKVGESWFQRFSIIPFTDILMQVLVQTTECLASSQWELQRMAQQVLPLLSEVFRFYNINIMKQTWNRYKRGSLSPMCYSSYLCLKESVLHAARFKRTLSKTGSTKETSQAQRSAEMIISCVSRALDETIPEIVTITKRKNFDKLTVVSVEILVLCSVHFPSHIYDKGHERHISEIFERLFILSFKDDDFAAYLSSVGVPTETEVSTDGFLGLSMKSNSHRSTDMQVLEFLFSCVQKHFLQYIKSCPIDNLAPLLPVLLKMITFSDQGKVDLHTLIQCCDLIVQDLKSGKTFSGITKEQYTCVKAGADKCISLLEQEINMYTLKHVTEIMLDLYEISEKSVDLGKVFKSIAAQVTKTEAEVKNACNYDDSNVEMENRPALLQMLSNEIRQSPIGEQLVDDFEEKDSDEDDGLPESQALGMVDVDDEISSGSPNVLWSRAKSLDTTDTLSDWDSWESDEENGSELKELFNSFLKRFQWLAESDHGKGGYFESALEHCDFKTRRIISNLMS